MHGLFAVTSHLFHLSFLQKMILQAPYLHDDRPDLDEGWKHTPTQKHNLLLHVPQCSTTTRTKLDKAVQLSGIHSC